MSSVAVTWETVESVEPLVLSPGSQAITGQLPA